MKKLVHLTSFLVMLTLASACDPYQPNYLNLIDLLSEEDLNVRNDLRIVSDGLDCKPEYAGTFLICESITVDDPIFLDPQSLKWIPDFDKEIGETVNYTNGNEITEFTVVNKDHYIYENRVHDHCSLEEVHLICQKNEVLYIEFLNELFGTDTIKYTLSTRIGLYPDQILGPKDDGLSLSQINTLGNANFSYRNRIGNETFGISSKHKFHEEIELLGNTYEEVLAFASSVNVWVDPYLYIYVKKGAGILGFKKDEVLWVKVD